MPSLLDASLREKKDQLGKVSLMFLLLLSVRTRP